ncbi:hypothetical protein [Thiohalocapsa sp. ML1]|jgi:hypothetical protein|uniref:hypothetical protein n=1 Tax=Thiohalocapsa sp. ML1 TaxID=1431688 RepID=UPI00073218C5|nr:hypothetical protein [Thiohalocapsa sp. ML1]
MNPGFLGKLLFLAALVAVLTSGVASAQRGGFDRPDFGSGDSDTGPAMVVLKCAVTHGSVPAGSAPNGNCSCSSSGEGSSFCSCSSGSGSGNTAPAAAPSLVVSEIYASPGVAEAVLADVAAADSCQAAVSMLNASAGNRTGKACDFSNLWWSCEL